MKKLDKEIIILTLIFGICITIYIPNVKADPAVMIQQYQVSPEILMPGDTAILTIQVKNCENIATEQTTLGSVGETTTIMRTMGAPIDNIHIVPAQSGDKRIRATSYYDDIGYLAAGASIDVNFQLIVDSNMSEGVYFPTVKIDVGGGIDVHYPIMIKVSNSSVDLINTNIPSKISKGGTTEIIVTAVNKRENVVNEVIITPHAEDAEFIPSSYFIGSLNAKTSQDMVFSVKPLREGKCNLAFDIRYKNGDNIHTNQLLAPISVIQTLDVAPIITNFPISITKGDSSQINIEVYNAKTARITGVLVTPICNATVIPSQYFIGSMDSDDVFSASFDIYTDTVDLGTHTIGFVVSFKQGNNYYEIPVISKSFSVVSGSGISYQSSGSSNSQSSSSNGIFQTSSLMTCLLSVFIIVVAIIVIVLLYVKRKKRRKST